MKIMFTLTKQDAWNCYKHMAWKAFQAHSFPYLAMWLLSFALGWLILTALYRFFGEKDFLFCLAMGFVQCFLGTIAYALSTRQRYFKNIAKTPDWIGDRMVELGKFDLRWSVPGTDGYHYHWSYFSDVVETRAYLYLILRGKSVLIIPKSAFSDSPEVQAFVAEVRTRWEQAKHKQRYVTSVAEEGVWPPSPRIDQ